jgi:hypothetical protein
VALVSAAKAGLEKVDKRHFDLPEDDAINRKRHPWLLLLRGPFAE